MRTVPIEPSPAASYDRTRCNRCGDPLPVDGACDCAGDPDRDEATAYAGLRTLHACIVRWGAEGDVEEVWL